jgi:hypothetical protein
VSSPINVEWMFPYGNDYRMRRLLGKRQIFLRIHATMPFETIVSYEAVAAYLVRFARNRDRGSLAAPPHPHHRTYGSVYGGSLD